MMLSWSLGGFPSANLLVAERFGPESPRPTPMRYSTRSPPADMDPVGLRRCAAWRAFSEALEQFPHHESVLYLGPQQYGPSNLLFANGTGFKATMLGLPYDDLQAAVRTLSAGSPGGSIRQGCQRLDRKA